jgi:hypothetical protein
VILKTYWPVVPLTVLWPLAHLLFFFARFHRMDSELLVLSPAFLLPGLISTIAVVYLFTRARPGLQRGLVVAAYLISLPIALIGSLLGGLMLPALLGVTLYGSVLSILGTLAGFGVGALLRHA